MGYRAFCPVCKKLVTDDIIFDNDNVESIHEHPVIILHELSTLKSGNSVKLVKLTKDAYFRDASRLDAELITAKLLRKISIPVPSKILTSIVQEILTIARELAVEDEIKEREKEKRKKKEKKGTSEKIIVDLEDIDNTKKEGERHEKQN